jgi:hypothetical protein
MRYPRWMPQNLTQGLLCAVLGLLCAVLAPFALNCRATYTKVTTILLHADGLVNEARLAAKKSVTASEDTDKAIVALGKLVDGIGQTNAKAGVLLEQLGGTALSATNAINATSATVAKLGAVADSTRERIDALASTQAKADAAIDALTTIPAHVNDALAPLPSLEQHADLLISNPKIDTLLGNVDAVTMNAARATKDLADKEHELFFPPPCKGSLCWVKKSWRIGRAVLELAEPAYYGIGIANGQ